MKMRFRAWRQWAREVRRETYALYLASRDPRVPWYVKALALCIVGYALSPIDLIPDFVPILGYLDDLVLIPLGITLVLRLIPGPVLAECRARAVETIAENGPANRVAAAVIVAVWVALLALAVAVLARTWSG